MGVVLGGQDVQAMRLDLAGGVEVVAGGIVEEARGAVEDVGEGGAFLLSAALTAGVGVADVLQAADGAVDGLDGGGGEGAFAGGGGFEAEAARLAHGGGEGPGREEGGHVGWLWWWCISGINLAGAAVACSILNCRVSGVCGRRSAPGQA